MMQYAVVHGDGVGDSTISCHCVRRGQEHRARVPCGHVAEVPIGSDSGGGSDPHRATCGAALSETRRAARGPHDVRQPKKKVRGRASAALHYVWRHGVRVCAAVWAAVWAGAGQRGPPVWRLAAQSPTRSQRTSAFERGTKTRPTGRNWGQPQRGHSARGSVRDEAAIWAHAQ